MRQREYQSFFKFSLLKKNPFLFKLASAEFIGQGQKCCHILSQNILSTLQTTYYYYSPLKPADLRIKHLPSSYKDGPLSLAFLDQNSKVSRYFQKNSLWITTVIFCINYFYHLLLQLLIYGVDKAPQWIQAILKMCLIWGLQLLWFRIHRGLSKALWYSQCKNQQS